MATDVVQFFGFDSGYCHAVLQPALLMAYDPSFKLPAVLVTNEFYRFGQLADSVLVGRWQAWLGDPFGRLAG